MGLKHAYKSLKPDPADPSIIGASKWNADHYFMDAAGAPIGNVGALLYSGAAGAITQIDSVAAGQVLASNGAGAVPAWTASPTLTSINFAGGITIDGGELGALDGVTPGIVTASKVVIVDANKDIATFRNVGIVTLTAALVNADNVTIASAGALAWSTDLKLVRDTANTLAQRNGTAAQTFRIFNTYTDPSNYERGTLQWSGNTFYVGTFALGSGTPRDLVFITGAGDQRWKIGATSGHFLASTDNTFDIGAAGATRPRNIFVSAVVAIGTTPATSGAIRLTNAAGVIAWRNAANTVDHTLWLDGSDILRIGGSIVHLTGGALQMGAAPALSGAIRLPNNVHLYARNAANTGDIVVIGSDASDRVQLSTTGKNIAWYGHLLAGTDNVSDIGASGANRPRNIYAAGDINAASITVISGPSFSAAGFTIPNTAGTEINFTGTGVGTNITSADSISILAGAGLFVNFGVSGFASVVRVYNTGLMFPTDNTYDIGLSGGSRPRHIYTAGNVVVGGGTVAIGASVATIGAIRMSNNTGSIYARNAGNTTDILVAFVDTSDRVRLGDANFQNFVSGADGSLIQFTGANSNIRIGTNPALTGAIRLPNNSGIYFRNAANTADGYGMFLDTTNVLHIGSGATNVNFQTGTISIGTNPAAGGPIRLANNGLMGWRNAANTGDVQFGVNASDQFYFSSGIAIGSIVATGGAIRLSSGVIIAARNVANTGNIRIAEVDAADFVLIGSSGGAGVIAGNASINTRLRGDLQTPVSLANGDWWVECIGTSPARVCAIKVRDGGATRTIGSITY